MFDMVRSLAGNLFSSKHDFVVLKQLYELESQCVSACWVDYVLFENLSFVVVSVPWVDTSQGSKRHRLNSRVLYQVEKVRLPSAEGPFHHSVNQLRWCKVHRLQIQGIFRGTGHL